MSRADDERACDHCGAKLHVDMKYGMNVHGVLRIECPACGFATFSTEHWALREYDETVERKKASGE